MPFRDASVGFAHDEVAFVASVSGGFPSIRGTGIFCFLAARKLGQAQQTEGGGQGRGMREKGTLSRKPHDFEKRPFDTFTVG